MAKWVLCHGYKFFSWFVHCHWCKRDFLAGGCVCSAIKDREMKTPNRWLKTSIVCCSIMPLNPWGWEGLSTVVFCKQFSSCVAIGGLIPPFSSISSCNRQEISSTAHKQACGPLLKHVKLESKLLCLTKKQFFLGLTLKCLQSWQFAHLYLNTMNTKTVQFLFPWASAWMSIPIDFYDQCQQCKPTSWPSLPSASRMRLKLWTQVFLV
jgi:hypothetical protein